MHPETMFNRKRRLSRFLATHTTCPTTNGTDLEVWAALKKERRQRRTELDRRIEQHRYEYQKAQDENFRRVLNSCWVCGTRAEDRPCDCDIKRGGK